MKKRIAILSTIFLMFVAGVLAFNMRFPVRHLDVIREHAGALDCALVLAVIKTESGFRENALSRAGAQGLMQLMPATAAEMAVESGMTDFEPQDVWLPEVNIALGAFYLNRLLNLYGCIELALAAYNAGQGRVNGWLRDPEISRDGETLHAIPFPETHNYLQRVNRRRRVYEIILTVTGRAER